MTEAELSLEAMSIDEDRTGDRLAALFRRLAESADEEERRTLLAELYDRCAGELYGHALWRCGDASLAADVVQDVFVKLAGGRRMDRVRRPRRYLLAMIHRAAVDRHRRRRTVEPIEEVVLATPASPPSGFDPVDAQRAALLLGRLPPRQREALYLRFYAELTFGEIGAVTGVSAFTAASRCRLGLRRLQRWLGQSLRDKEDT